MTRDESTEGWLPLAGGGLANVSIRKRARLPPDVGGHEYIIYGQRISDQTVRLFFRFIQGFTVNLTKFKFIRRLYLVVSLIETYSISKSCQLFITGELASNEMDLHFKLLLMQGPSIKGSFELMTISLTVSEYTVSIIVQEKSF